MDTATDIVLGWRNAMALSPSDLLNRLRTRAKIRRQIPTRKSVQEGKQDRLADLLDEAADRIELLEDLLYERGQSDEY